MKIVKAEVVKIDDIIAVLRANGLVILPTETVYGAMVDATNPKAVNKLNKYKKRPLGKPFSIAVADQLMAEHYVDLNKTAKNLYQTFLPGPMTIVSRGKHKVAPGVESETGTLGVRIPDYPLVIEVVKRFGKPLTATSANASYQKRPYQISDILDNISDKQKGLIDLIIDAGKLPRREPSTVVDTTLDDPVILRQGDIKLKDKNEVLSRSPENTQNLGKELWQKYEQYFGKRAIVFALEGPMGAGKTQFTKGLAKAMGITEEVVSPTFSLVESYSLPTTNNQQLTTNFLLHHYDAWRLETPDELKNLEFAKNITDKSIIAIEWADRVAGEVRKYNEEAVMVWVNIEYGKAENDRLISWGAL